MDNPGDLTVADAENASQVDGFRPHGMETADLRHIKFRQLGPGNPRTSRASAMPDHVGLVVGGRPPREILPPIVVRIAVEMTAFRPGERRRADEILQDQPMDFPLMALAFMT